MANSKEYPGITTDGSTLGPEAKEDNDMRNDEETIEDDEGYETIEDDLEDEMNEESLNTTDYLLKDLDQVYEKYVSNSPDEYEAKLESICAFAADHNDVYTKEKFTDILDYYQNMGYLTDAQMDFIDQTVEKFNLYYW